MEQDDMDNWRNATDAGRSVQAKKYLAHIGMGVGHETTHPLLPGKVHPRSTGELPQRYMYARWQEFMNAASWSKIPLDTATAKYEGSATMKE